jgi:EAL domain-containing protein (putative c-di-GMP-specific phosphodiesterase class I)
MTSADARLLPSFERALADQKLGIVYQPKISLKDGHLTRVEALVRWEDAELGPIPPSRFVPLAEQHGLIDPLTEWGLRAALRQLPFTEVKIDRSFVTDLPHAHDSRLIVRSIIELAHGLGLVATAEGVETIDQLRAVHELGCDVVQGYLVSPPLDGDELIPWKNEFRKRWPSLLTDDSLELWSNIEADALGQR